jgi:hypothetical protein
MATETETAAVETKSPREAAEEFLSTVTEETETTETPEPKPVEKPPGAKPEAEELKAAREERRRASELLAKSKAQHEALDRRTAKVKELEERHAAREKEFDDAESSVESMVEYLAKRHGKSPNDVWNDIAEQLRNGGKRTPESETRRELDAIKRELESERKSKAEREAQAKADEERKQALEREQNTSTGIETFRAGAIELVTANPEQYPTLQAYPKKAVGTMTLDLISSYCDRFKAQNGNYPTELPPLSDFLDFLEGEESAEQAPSAPAKASVAKPKPRIPTNNNASSEPDLRTLSMDERRELAMKMLDAGEL